MKTPTLLLVLLILTSCCKKEDEEEITPPISDCLELGIPPLNDWTYLVDTNYYMYPCFNPNNSNEIIFTKKNNATDVTKLYKYNLQTQEKTLLHVGYQIFPSNWGSNDWILLNLAGNSIWKIKSDGSELTQLTNTGNDFNPIWNMDATMFGAFRGLFADNLQKTILYTPEAIPIDTLDHSGVGTNSCWSLNSLTCSAGENGPVVYDLLNDSVVFTQLRSCNRVVGSHWINQSEFLWSYEEGIFKTNYITGSTELVKESCRTRLYFDPTFHPSLNKFIWCRVDLKQLNAFQIEVKSRLFMMNPDGSNETEIIIE